MKKIHKAVLINGQIMVGCCQFGKTLLADSEDEVTCSKCLSHFAYVGLSDWAITVPIEV